MSGECDECGEHTLECSCKRARYRLERACGRGCPCRGKDHDIHLNAIRRPMKEGIEPQDHLPEVKYVNVRGREEHEAVLKDADLCDSLGLDRGYEIMVYLKRWGSWLNQD